MGYGPLLTNMELMIEVDFKIAKQVDFNLVES